MTDKKGIDSDKAIIILLAIAMVISYLIAKFSDNIQVITIFSNAVFAFMAAFLISIQMAFKK